MAYSSGSQILASLKSLRGLLTAQIIGPHLIFDPIELEWDPRICIFNKIPGDADPAGSHITL